MRISQAVSLITLVLGVAPSDGRFWTKLKEELINDDDDGVLDNGDWRNKHDSALQRARNDSACSYVQEVLKTDYKKGFLEIACSPELIYNMYGILMGQYVRIIFSVDYEEGDVINLYVEDLKASDDESSKQLLDEIEVPGADLDHIDSKIFYDFEKPYYAEYVRKNKKVVVSKKYHRYHPEWMWCMKEMLGPRRLDRLLLPGTHDSGSYTSPSWWKNRFYITSIYYQYVFTQEDSVYNQLMQGARILDLRIAKYNSSIMFYVNHSKFKVHPLLVVLDQIVQFLKDCPHEIVVLDIHQMLEGFETSEDYDKLAQYLRKHLGSLIFENSGIPRWNYTLEEIWKTDGRIFIGFQDYPSSARNKFYPEIDQIWGRKDNLNDFVTYMNDNLPKQCNDSVYWLSSAMVELTPIGINVLKDTYGGLRHLAGETSGVITNMFTVGKWGEATQAASVDFLASTGIVTAAIIQNSARLQKEHSCH